MKRLSILIFCSLWLIPGFGQVQMKIDSIKPKLHAQLPLLQPISVYLNSDVEPKSLAVDSALKAFGQFTGSYNAFSQAAATRVGNRVVNYTPRNGFKPNERIQLSASSSIQSVVGLPVTNPQVHSFRVAPSGGEGQFGDSIVFDVDFAGPDGLFQLSDMDADGDVDIVTYDTQGYIVLKLNAGNDWVSQLTYKVGADATFLHVADLQSDGYPDIILGYSTLNKIDIHFFAAGILSSSPRAITLKNTPQLNGREGFVPISGDVDADGDLDLVIGQGSMISIFKFSKKGTTYSQSDINVTNGSGANVFLADMNNDGALDIVTQSGVFAANDTKGNFKDFTNTTLSALAIEEADMDNDGDVDIVQLLPTTNGVLVRINNNDGGKIGLFKSITVPLPKASAESMTSGDFNADGFLDIAFSSYDNSAFVFLFNDRKGSLLSPNYHYSNAKRNILSADMDNDGDVDLVLMKNTKGDDFKFITIYLNQKPCKHLLVTNSLDDVELYSCGMLRYALAYANEHPGVDTIRFDLSPKEKVITLEREIYIREPFVLIGPGKDKLFIDGNNRTSLFNMDLEPPRVLPRLQAAGDTTLIQGVSFINGSTANPYQAGGVTFIGPGKTLLLEECFFANNSALYGGAGLYFDGANLNIGNSEFLRNSVPSDLGDGAGAKIYSASGRVRINNSYFAENEGGSANTGVQGKGHGLFLDGQNYSCQIHGSTFANNRADIGGAIFYSNNLKSKDSITILNSTFSGNVAKNGGGAIYMTGAGKLYLQHSTIAYNGKDTITDFDPFGPYYPNGGGIFVEGGSVYSFNTILAGNKGRLGDDIYLVGASTGTFASQGGNLIGMVGENGKTITVAATDKAGSVKLPLHPMLAPLANYGGRTLTHLPFALSPAINSGLTPIAKLDQRGLNRTVGSATDIGAVEVQDICSNPLLVTSKLDTFQCGTLRYAVLYANSKSGFDLITIDPKLGGDSILLKSRLTVEEGLAITCQKEVILSARSEENIFKVSNADSLSFTNLVFRNSKDTVHAALHYPIDEGKLTLRKVTFEKNFSVKGNAGALFTKANKIRIDSCRFYHNNVGRQDYNMVLAGGLGVQIDRGMKAFVELKNTEFVGNTSMNPLTGAGGMDLYIYYTDSLASLLVENSTFARNSGLTGGGMKFVSNLNNRAKIINSTFSGNTAWQTGGGLQTSAYKLIIEHSTFTLNKAVKGSVTSPNYTPSGGGITVYSGNAHLNSTIVANNDAGGQGNDLASNSTTYYKFYSRGYNLIGDTVQSGGFNQARNQYRWIQTDIVGTTKSRVNPLLEPLAYNGGRTLNHLPLASSPVINKGDPVTTLLFDQRGKGRKLSNGVDIGAVEFDGVVPIAYAGKDSSTCDSTVVLRATPAISGYKGYWTIANKPAKGTIADSTKATTSSKLSIGRNVFIWTITNGNATLIDTVVYIRNIVPNKPTIQNPTEACGPLFTLTHSILPNDASNKYKWTRRGAAGSDTLRISGTQTQPGTSVYVISTTVSNYKEGSNTLYLTTSNLAGCARRDSISLSYFPYEKPSLGKDTTVYEATYTYTVKPIRRNNEILQGYWKVLSGSSKITDTTSLTLSATPLSNGTNANRFAYFVKNFCKTSDTVWVTRFMPADSANAGPDQIICDSVTTLAAIKPTTNLTGAWRSKKASVIFADSTKYDTRVWGLPKDTTTLIWVVKTGTQVKDADAVLIRNNKPTQANGGIFYHTCTNAITLTANAANAARGEFGTWSTLTAGVLITNPNSTTASVTALREFPTVNYLVWNIRLGSCTSRDTVPVYYARKIFTRLDDLVGDAGRDIIGRVDTNDLRSLGDSTKKLQIVLWAGQNKPQKSITGYVIRRDSIIFKTNLKLPGNDTLKYLITNQCGVVSDTGTIIVRARNKPPKYTGPPIFSSKGEDKIAISLTYAQLDTNRNVRKVEFISSTSGVRPTMFHLNDSTIVLEIDYSSSKYEGRDYLQFRVTDDNNASSIIIIPIDVEKRTKTSEVIIFNAVSPNGDGSNDILEIEGMTSEQMSKNSISIYNRWGDEVYAASKYDNKTVVFDGKNLPDGTYYYVLDLGDGSKLVQGYIVLKR